MTLRRPLRPRGGAPGALALALAAVLPASLPAQTSAPAPNEPARAAALPGGSAALRSGARVTLNFVNADLEAVTRAVAAMIQRQIAIDSRVKGTITLYSEQPLTIREAYLNYLTALRGLGFAVVESAGLLKVVPEAEAKLQTGVVSIGDVAVRGDQVITQIFQLRYENPNSLVPVLRPLISANNTINASPGSNSLVITDYAENLQRIGRIIATLDQPATTEIEIVPLQHAVASDLVPIVQRLADGGVATPGAVAAASANVVADPRSNALVLRATNPTRMAAMKAAIAKLDRPLTGSATTGNIWVVYLKNADAVRLATVLRAAFAPGGGAAAASGGAAPAPTSTPTAAAGAAGSTAATTPVSATAAPSTGGTIQADPATNSLIITAPEPQYRQLRAVIDQLDSRRAQVYIESMIVSIDAQKAAEFGFQWQALSGQKGSSNIYGAGTNFGTTGNILQLSAATATNSATDALSVGVAQGLNIGVLNKVGNFYTLGLLAKFLETNAGANILSTPNLVALDNEEAKIVIGQNVPFITGSFTNTGGSAGSVNPFQTIERKDVGLTLRVRPQIGEGGTVRMQVFQENSAVASNLPNAGPITSKSAIETTVVVDDGQVMVLGGLLSDEYRDDSGKVPVLGDVPVLGHLFRNEGRRRVKNNLMVFLRPIVLRNQEEANSLTIDRYDSIRAMQQSGQPVPSQLVPVNDAPLLPAAPQPGSPPATTAPVR